MNSNNINTKDFSLKNFWERKEGTAGMIVLAIVGFAGIIGLYNALPYLITLVQNVIGLMGLVLAAIAIGIPLTLIVSILFSKKFHTLVSTGFKILMRKMMSLFVSVYPIDIIKEKISEMERKVEDIATSLSKLLGIKNRILKDIATAKKELDDKIRTAKLAQQKGDETVASVEARAAQRRKERVETLQQILEKIEMLHSFLEKMRKNISLLVSDKKDEVQQLELQYKVVNIAHEIKTAAKAAMGKALGEDEMFNLALEYVADDMTQKMGDIEEFMLVNEEILNSLELQNEVKEAKGLELLNKYEKKLDKFVLDTSNSVKVDEIIKNSRYIDVDETENKKATVGVGKFIK